MLHTALQFIYVVHVVASRRSPASTIERRTANGTYYSLIGKKSTCIIGQIVLPGINKKNFEVSSNHFALS